MDKEQILKHIYAIHSKNLKNLEELNNFKIILFFSGIPGSGKTTLAKEIEERYNGIRLNNDDIRDIIVDALHLNIESEEVHKLTKEYSLYLTNKLSNVKNGLIILDSSIDRSFEQIKKWADKNSYKLFVIKLDISKEEIINRINLRQGKDAHIYLDNLDRWWNDYVEFNKLYRADFIYHSEKDLNNLFEVLEPLVLKSGKLTS